MMLSPSFTFPAMEEDAQSLFCCEEGCRVHDTAIDGAWDVRLRGRNASGATGAQLALDPSTIYRSALSATVRWLCEWWRSCLLCSELPSRYKTQCEAVGSCWERDVQESVGRCLVCFL